MSEIRTGELVVQSAGGKCCVCKLRIVPGPAVQVSRQSSGIRHLECLPKTDSRGRREWGPTRRDKESCD